MSFKKVASPVIWKIRAHVTDERRETSKKDGYNTLTIKRNVQVTVKTRFPCININYRAMQ